jgi:hypothetical protein
MSPQRLLDSNPAGDFAFYLSTMKLQLKLLHEEDLSRLLGDLRSQAKALILIKAATSSACRQRRRACRWPANLLAECEIDWLTCTK